MEIRDVETYTLRVPLDRPVGDSRLEITDVYWVVVELHTDDGRVGTGWMGSLGFAPDMLERFVDSQFADVVTGRDPHATEAVNRDMRLQSVYYGETGIAAWPRAAIDVAMWDLKAQAAGVPLYRLLGGEEGRVRAYASSMDTPYDQDELGALHGGYADEGFTAFKTKVGSRDPVEEAARVREVREAVGPDAEIFVDANQAWSVKEAVENVAAIDEYDVGWVEEPIPEWDLDGHRRLADRIDPPLATGEMFYRPERFEWLFDHGAVELVQPDLIRGGGVSGMWEVGQLAHRHHVPVASHFYYSVSAHVVAAMPTGRIVEYIPEYDAGPILEDPATVEDGYVDLPDRPGHGYRVSDAARAEYGVEFE